MQTPIPEAYAACVTALSAVRATIAIVDAQSHGVLVAPWQQHALALSTAVVTVVFAAAGGSPGTLIAAVCMQALGSAGALITTMVRGRP